MWEIKYLNSPSLLLILLTIDLRVTGFFFKFYWGVIFFGFEEVSSYTDTLGGATTKKNYSALEASLFGNQQC